MPPVTTDKIRWIRRSDLTLQEITYPGAMTPVMSVAVAGLKPEIVFTNDAAPHDEIVRLDMNNILCATFERAGEVETGQETEEMRFDVGIGASDQAFQEIHRNVQADATTANLLALNFIVYFVVPRPSTGGIAPLNLIQYKRNNGTLRAVVVARNLIAARNLELIV